MKRTTYIAAIVLSVMAVGPASAATETYMFLVNQSAVVQRGGPLDIEETHRIRGQFQLTIDTERQTACFDWVDATLSESPYLETRSLDQLFFMTELLGTVVNSTTVEFVSPWLAPCPTIRLTVTLQPGSARITTDSDNDYCECRADPYCYELDAVAAEIDPNWEYQYFDNFQTDKATNHSYAHSIFWPVNAFPPAEPYLSFLSDGANDRVLAFLDYAGQPAHLGYCFPIASRHKREKVSGILKIEVEFPDDAHISQSPGGYLLYSVSSDGHTWSAPKAMNAGRNQIPLESVQGACYVMFLGTRATIDNLAVHLTSQPATIHVPGDYPSIQDAINAATDGDVIEVSPGTYTGAGNRDIEFQGKAITVRSSHGPEQTIIDCGSGPGSPGPGSQHRGFYFHQAETGDSVLRGFTIINGRINGSEIPADDMRWNLTWSHPVGGGVYCEYSSPTIVDCVFRDCVTEIGGGIGCVGGQPTIVDCLIEQCSAGGLGAVEWGGRGGAIGLIRGADARINKCIFRSNTAYHNGSGGAVYARRAGARVSDCEIYSNGPREAEGLIIGGGAYASDPQTNLVFSNCVFSNNFAVAGAAIYAQRGTSIAGCPEAECPPCRVHLTNCTIAHNRVIPAQWGGPGAEANIQSDGANIKLKNSIVWHNQDLEVLLIDPPTDPVVYCDIEGGYPGLGNIDEPPLFAPVAVPDYHLQSHNGRYHPATQNWILDPVHSPCIDAGDPNDPVRSEPAPNGGRINMGAYGGAAEASKGYKRTVYHVDAINGANTNSGLSRNEAFATIQKGIDASTHGDIVLVWPAIYVEDIYFDGKAITVQSAADAAVVVADSDYAFTFYDVESAESVLRNFVITGSAIGIYCDGGSRPTLQNLTITGNGYGVFALWGADPDISNCILWDNTGGDLFECEARYSCIETLNTPQDEAGNISRNPLFADPNNGDYHLMSTSGRYRPADDVWVIDEMTSPCIDGGDPLVKPQRERMPNGGRLNMGAYGGTAYASMSEWPLKADIDHSGLVNGKDLAILADSWKGTVDASMGQGGLRGDIDRNGRVNCKDLRLLAESWLDSLSWASSDSPGIDIVMPTDGTVIRVPQRNREQ